MKASSNVERESGNRWNGFVIDAHLDLAYNALGFGRNYSRGARWTRDYESDTEAAKYIGQCAVGLPDLVRGRVGIVFGSIFTAPAKGMMSAGPLTYRDAQEAHEVGMKQLDFYHRLADQEPHVRVIESKRDLTAALDSWNLDVTEQGVLLARAGKPRKAGPHQVGIVPLMEGADPILEPAELERWAEHGLRIVGPAWTATRYAGGTMEPGGLTKLGRELLEMIASLRLILDVSHLAQQALFEALEIFEGGNGALIASHSNPQRIMPTDRHLPDKAIELIAERKGVMGIVLCNAFLKQGWGKGSRKHEVVLDDVVRAIDYICQVTGSADYVGIGSDLDGGFGAEAIPNELDSSRDLYLIGDALLQRGFGKENVDKVMHGNWLRILNTSLPSS